MNLPGFLKNEITLAKAATIILFMALIRCISEPFRLNYYAEAPIPFETATPFLIGALISAIALLIMTVLTYYHKHKMIIGS